MASAYRQLAGAGLVLAGRGRQGTRVAPAFADQAVGLPTGPLPVGGDLIDVRSGSPDAEFLPSLSAALSFAATGLDVSYGEVLTHPELGRVAAAAFEADGIASESMVVTNGSMDAIDRALRARLRPGERVGVEDPGHVPVHRLVRSAGLVPIPIPVDRFGMQPDALRNAMASKLSAIIATPRAQNPSGAAFSADRAAQLSEVLAAASDVMVIQDDHAGPIAGTDYHQISVAGKSWLTVRSLGKSLGPDLRVALVAGDRTTIDRISVGISNGPGWVSHVLQRAVAYMLTDDDVQAQITQASSAYVRRRTALLDRLKERGVPAMGRSGFNIWLPVEAEQAVVEALAERGYAVAAGEPWRIRSAPAVRVSTSTLADHQIEALADAIAEVVVAPVRRAAPI